MQKRSQNLFVSVMIAMGVALALAVVSRAQSTTPVDPVEAAPAVSSEAAAEVASVETTATETEPASESKVSGVRRLDDVNLTETEEEETDGSRLSVTIEIGEAEADADRESDAEELEEVAEASVEVTHHDRMPIGSHTVSEGHSVREMVSFFGSSVLAGESRGGVVSIVGDTTITGIAGGEAVAILGNLTVGPHAAVGGEGVAILGNVHIDGEVDGEVVAILGSVTLGPHAVVHGEVVAIGGQLHRDPGAVVHGGVQEIHFLSDGFEMTSLRVWIYECLLWGRPLAFNSELNWAWLIAINVFLFYVLIALIFPRATDRCVATLNERPGYSLLSMLLATLMVPVLIVLLVATGIGALLVPFVILGVFVGGVFGEVVMHAWLGRKLTRFFGQGFLNHAASAAFIGGVLILLLYTVPFLGFFVWKVFGMIGWGVVIYTLILEIRRNRPVAPPSVPPRAVPTSAPLGGPAEANEAAAPELPVSALPRAGFWFRILASLLDTVIVGVVCGLLYLSPWFMLVFAIYCWVLWALKGTTIGGIVCGLKVVRLDERPMDWSIAGVRILGGFLSFVVLGLGFIWVAFDEQKQSWHDKIAGTVVVRVPKSVSLI